MASFETLLIKTDVTALKILKKHYLLAGIGNTLSAFFVKERKLISQTTVFCGQRVHGITPSKDEKSILVYGGKQVKLLSCQFDPDFSVRSESFHIHTDDWILTLIWTENDTQLALLTAHNVIQIWDIESKTNIKSCKYEENCIIYSGLLLDVGTDILSMSGTVFSQVVIWSAGEKSSLHKLNGHKGVIFSISYNREKNIIVTTSDDRSVIIWNIFAEENIPKDSLDYWKKCTISLKVTMFGHTARVMRNIALPSGEVISIGEDSAMCVWHIDGSLIAKRKTHQDGGLWSMDVGVESDLIVTGGSDSGISLHSLSANLQTADRNLQSLPPTRSNPKRIAVTYRGNIACLCENGELLYYDFEMLEWCKWDVTNFKHSNMAISKCRQYLALSNINGELDIVAETCKFDPRLAHCIAQKIGENLLSLHWLRDRNIIACEKGGVLSIWNARGDKLIKTNEFVLPNCKERWLTVASEFFEPTYHLMVGDRCGNVHIYAKNSIHPVQTMSKVHGRLGTNSIEVIDDAVVTCGRDGTVKHFKLFARGENCSLRLLHRTKYPFNWIERFVDKGDFICGFAESRFAIWNAKDNANVVEIDCGGGHRSWDINKQWKRVKDDFSSFLRLTFIKNALVHSIDVEVNKLSTNIVPGTHIREINIIQTVECESGSRYAMITGGEDTTMRLHSLELANNTFDIDFKETKVIRRHLSSVRCLCVKKMDRDRNLIFSGGGRAQICVWLHRMDTEECSEIGHYMLKGDDLKRKGNVGGWKNCEVDFEAETRIMSIVCVSSEEFAVENSNFLLLAGCSDGFMRIFEIHLNETDECNISLTHTILTNDERCILNIRYISMDNSIIVITTATNGSIAFWNLSSLFLHSSSPSEPFYRFAPHKAGINALDVQTLSDNRVLLVTGGDDNDIQAHILNIEIRTLDQIEVELVARWHCDGYHSAQISGIKLIGNEYILSASIDQRITALKWACDNDRQLQCDYVTQYHTSVPDVQGMSVVFVDGNTSLLCVYGKGIEFIKFRVT